VRHQKPSTAGGRGALSRRGKNQTKQSWKDKVFAGKIRRHQLEKKPAKTCLFQKGRSSNPVYGTSTYQSLGLAEPRRGDPFVKIVLQKKNTEQPDTKGD